MIKHALHILFFFIAKKISTLKIRQIFPSLTKQQESQHWGTCVWLPNWALYILWAEPERHQFLWTCCHHQTQKCHYALWTPFTIVMFRRLNVELVQSYDCFFCVSNYIVMKDNDLNYFPHFEEKKYFPLYSVFFFLLEKKIQLYILSH